MKHLFYDHSACQWTLIFKGELQLLKGALKGKTQKKNKNKKIKGKTHIIIILSQRYFCLDLRTRILVVLSNTGKTESILSILISGVLSK